MGIKLIIDASVKAISQDSFAKRKNIVSFTVTKMTGNNNH